MTKIVNIGILGDHSPCFEPMGHLAIFGQTQKAGKTTSLRTLASGLIQQGFEVLLFRTGKGEISFPGAKSVPPFFRERLDWRGVETLIWSYLDEKSKMYRPILMRAAEGASTLEQFRDRVAKFGRQSKHGWVKDRTLELEHYFDEILPVLRGGRLSTSFLLSGPGKFVVMDLEEFPQTVQQLVVAATLEHLLEVRKSSWPMVVMLPEAQRFIGAKHQTPATRIAGRFAAESAKLDRYLWIDSQFLTGVDQGIMRHVSLTLQGVQQSDLEVNRIVVALEGVTKSMVKKLHVGDFLLATRDGVRQVHIPLVAREESRVTKEEDVDAEERKELEEQIAGLRGNVDRLHARNMELERQLKDEHARAEANAMAAAANAAEAVRSIPSFEDIRDQTEGVMREAEAAAEKPQVAVPKGKHLHLEVTVKTPCMVLLEEVVTIETTTDELDGRIGKLIADGFFDEKKQQVEVANELIARGGVDYKSNGGQRKQLQTHLVKFAEWGFLRRGGPTYVVTPTAKARIDRRPVPVRVR
jgi:hypothetical protein